MKAQPTELFERDPRTWKEFEQKVEQLHYRAYWRRSYGDELQLVPAHGDIFWERFRNGASIDTRYATEITRRLDKSPSLTVSKKRIVEESPELLATIRARTERLEQLWPVAVALAANVDRNVKVEVWNEGISITYYDHQVKIDDDLNVQVQVQCHGLHTRMEMEHLRERVDALTAEYEQTLAPFKTARLPLVLLSNGGAAA